MRYFEPFEEDTDQKLQNSGSDIIVEHDMAHLFGRCRIEAQVASSFKTAVSKSASAKLLEGIYLENGPGPTVVRAFSKDQTPYFATVLQCSLLCSVLDKTSLAGAIRQYFEKKAECAPAGETPTASPNEEGIFGFLQACEEQTSSYNWDNQLKAIGSILDYEEYEVKAPIPSVILRGLIDMLPLVQHFPENHLIEIENCRGVCLLVAWIHLVLGLCVTVIGSGNSSHHNARAYQNPKTFGSGPPQVVVNVDRSNERDFIQNGISLRIEKPSITLLAASAAEGMNEKLFHLQPDPDESEIEAVFKLPAKGYARRIFERLWGYDNKRDSFLEEIALITSGYAWALSMHLYKSIWRSRATVESPQDSSVSESSESERCLDHDNSNTYNGIVQCVIDPYQFLNAAQFLFNNRNISQQSVREYAERYSCSSLDRFPQPSERIHMILDNISDLEKRKSRWESTVRAIWDLSSVLLAFAHVRDLKLCENLSFSHVYHIPRIDRLGASLPAWNGQQPLIVDDFEWFDALADLMIHNYGIEGRPIAPRPSLLSDRGWSIYLSSFSNTDPSCTDAGFVVIRKGIPRRNNVTKHAIFDTFVEGRGFGPGCLRTVSKASEQATLCCPEAIEFGPPLCGERGDSFIVGLRIQTIHDNIPHTLRTGFADLHKALWPVEKTTPCLHSPLANEGVMLEPWSVTVSGHLFHDFEYMDERLIICLTAYNMAARWRALLSLAATTRISRRILLRGRDCCLACTIGQTAASTGKWLIIL